MRKPEEDAGGGNGAEPRHKSLFFDALHDAERRVAGALTLSLAMKEEDSPFITAASTISAQRREGATEGMPREVDGANLHTTDTTIHKH